MKKLSKLFIIIMLSLSIKAQAILDGAESVAYHAATNSYFVSSLMNNQVVKIDENRNYSVLIDNIVSFGNCIKGDTLFLSSGNEVVGIDVYTGVINFTVAVEGNLQFDGITYDNNNNIFVVETRSNRIVKINLLDKNYSYFVETGLEQATQDLYYDKFNDRIIICAWGINSAILSLDPVSAELKKLRDTDGRFDGVTIDDNGFVYFGSHLNGGQVHMYFNDFSNEEPFIIYQGIEEPAGLDFNRENNTIAVPSFVGDSVAFIQLPEKYFYPSFSVDVKTGNAPLTVKFNDNSKTNIDNINYQWDFDNDGTIDSDLQNPEFTFHSAGNYTVKVEFESADGNFSSTKENLILVFDGESSLFFEKENSKVFIDAAEEINLGNEFTIEAYIKPQAYPTFPIGKTILDKSVLRMYLTGNVLGLIGDRSLAVALTLSDESKLTLSAPNDAIQINKWQHVAVSFNSLTNNAKLFINGIEYEPILVGSGIISTGLKDNLLSDLYFGNNSSGDTPFLGNLDEIRIWNKALTSSEINENLLHTLIGNETNLVGYWNMNEGNGETSFDQTSNQNNGLLEEILYREGVIFDEIVSVENDSENRLPKSFLVEQNYPNPFNPTTSIEYSIPATVGDANYASPTNVTLRVYDILGNEVATLVNENKSPGNYRVNFDASALSSGIYFYKIDVGNFVQTKKMILLK